MGNNPQESLENTINTMGTLLGVHPIVPWRLEDNDPFGICWDLSESRVKSASSKL